MMPMNYSSAVTRPGSDFERAFGHRGFVHVLTCEGDDNLYVVEGSYGSAHIHLDYSHRRTGSHVRVRSPEPWRVIATTPVASPLTMFFGQVADYSYRGSVIHGRDSRASCTDYYYGYNNPACSLAGVDPTAIPRPTAYRHFVFVERLATDGACAGQFELGYASTSWGQQSGVKLPFAYEGLTFTGICMGTASEDYARYFHERFDIMDGVRPVALMDSRWNADGHTLQGYVYSPGSLSHLVFETDVRTGASRTLVAITPELLPHSTEDWPRYGNIISGFNIESETLVPRFEGTRLVPGRDKFVMLWESGRAVVVDFSNPQALTAQLAHGEMITGGSLEGRDPANNPDERFGFEFEIPPYDFTNPTAPRPATGFHYTIRGGETVRFSF
jgi:hypothetical protein